MIDALGFKGIWKREDPTLVLTKLRALENLVQTDLLREHDRRRDSKTVPLMPLPDVVFLSDTIFIAQEGAAPPPPKAPRPNKPGLALARDSVLRVTAVTGVANRVSRVLAAALKLPPPLIFRGVITFGEYANHKNFIVGPAVDEAAELMDAAAGGFVWCARSACRAIGIDNATNNRGSTAFLDYRVPMKGGHHLAAPCVSPFPHDTTEEHVTKVLSAVAASMDVAGLDIEMKRQETLAFVRHAGSLAIDRSRQRALPV